MHNFKYKNLSLVIIKFSIYGKSSFITSDRLGNKNYNNQTI